MPRFSLPHRWIRNPDERLNAGFVQDNFEAVEQGVEQALTPVPVVTALPASPFDGLVVDYVADATNGVVWRLRYRAASGSSYKWEFVGGGYLFDGIANEANKTVAVANTYEAFTAPITLTMPFAGDYEAVFTGNRVQANATLCSAYVRVSASSGTATYASADEGYANFTAQYMAGPFAVSHVITGVSASATVAGQRTHSGTVAQVSYANCVLKVRPIRVG